MGDAGAFAIQGLILIFLAVIALPVSIALLVLIIIFKPESPGKFVAKAIGWMSIALAIFVILWFLYYTIRDTLILGRV